MTVHHMPLPLKAVLFMFDPFQDKKVDDLNEAIELSKQTGLKIHWKRCQCLFCRDGKTIRVS